MTLQRSRTLRLFGWLLDIGAVCWLCLYPLFATVSVFVLFLLVGQGRELLYILVEPKYDGWQQPQRLVVYMAFAALAVAVWHTSRVLLAVRYHGLGTQSRTNADSAEMAHLRAEFPRTLAFVVLTIPSVAWLAGGHYRPAIVALLVELVVMYVLNYRETALSGHAHTLRGTPLLRMERVPKRTKWIVAAWLLYALVLVQAIVNFPVVVPRVLGAASIVLMAFTGWTIFGGFVLTLWPKSYGLPSMAVAVPLLLALVSMWTNDNHAPRTYDGPVLARVPRTDAEATFDAWLHARRLPAASAYPVFIVAAEGGGLRAAYWTATVLGYLQDHWPGDDHFSDHVFAISGVSGGVRGSAVLTVSPPAASSLSSLAVSPTSVIGGTTSTATVALTSAAPGGGATVSVSSSNTAVATLPASVTVAAGATSATFTITTSVVGASTPAMITGAFGGATRTAALTVTPPPPPAGLSAVSVSPTSVAGGAPYAADLRSATRDPVILTVLLARRRAILAASIDEAA